MKYLEVTVDFVDFKDFDPDIDKLFIEINEKGIVQREVGIGTTGNVVHRHPSDNFKFGHYGIFDLAKFDASVESNIRELQFKEIWDKD